MTPERIAQWRQLMVEYRDPSAEWAERTHSYPPMDDLRRVGGNSVRFIYDKEDDPILVICLDEIRKNWLSFGGSFTFPGDRGRCRMFAHFAIKRLDEIEGK